MLKFKFLSAVFIGLFLAGCSSKFSSPYAGGHYVASPKQCVPFAREASGIQLYGDAHTWWQQVRPPYVRGNIPATGAVLVLSNTARMTHGHLAVVKRILNNRQIEVTHSNWGSNWKSRRAIYDYMRAEDVSPSNDWTQVRFWNKEYNMFGFPYAAYGFIYKQ